VIDNQMLSSLEFLHYCRRFQDTVFSFVASSSEDCRAVLMDLRVLGAARIRQLVFCPADSALAETLDSWNRSGDRFVVIHTTSSELGSAALLQRIRANLVAGNVPFVAISNIANDLDARRVLDEKIVRCAATLGSKKVFFLGQELGLVVGGKFRSYPSPDEIDRCLAEGIEMNLPAWRVRFFLDQQCAHDIDIVIVQARRGAIYEEVFTHAGSGTLLSREYKNILRQADEGDVRDIMAIMQPYIAERALKNMTEDDLLGMISSFMVFAVNDQIIAAAALINYDNAAEVGKLCTLPRFQARGRARELVRALIQRAAEQGKDYVFALTVNPQVGEFFEKLGFVMVERGSLPDGWKKGYDFSRPSTAYRYSIR
jgi:N-acetylglutamate synthase-like GNAT family acetyltransferase